MVENAIKQTLLSLLRAADERSLPCLVIGGHAVILHGVPRFTRDIDLAIREEDIHAWHELLGSCGYRFYHRTAAFSQFEPVSPGNPVVDLMHLDGRTWTKLDTASQAVSLGSPVQRADIPAPLHLVAMKLQASRSPHRRRDAQDWDDVRKLVRTCKIDLTDKLAREIIMRYGGEESLRQLEADDG